MHGVVVTSFYRNTTPELEAYLRNHGKDPDDGEELDLDGGALSDVFKLWRLPIIKSVEFLVLEDLLIPWEGNLRRLGFLYDIDLRRHMLTGDEASGEEGCGTRTGEKDHGYGNLWDWFMA